jgi:hypothetical protein
LNVFGSNAVGDGLFWRGAWFMAFYCMIMGLSSTVYTAVSVILVFFLFWNLDLLMMNIFMTCQMKNLALHVDEKSCGSITVFFNQRLEDLD